MGQPERSYISWDAPDMQIVVERSGELLLGSELEDLRLSPGGTLRIRGWRDANGADGDRSQPSDLQFEARADESGHTTVRWLIAGVEQSLDAEARAWVVAAVAHLQEHDRRRDVERSQAERQRDRTQELEERQRDIERSEAERQRDRTRELEERQRDIEAAQMERRARLESEQVEVGSSSAPRRVQVLPEVRVKMIPEVKVLPEIQPDTEAIVAAQLPVLSRVTVVPIVTPEAVSLARVTVGTSARRWGPGWKWIGSHAADGTRLEIGYRGEFDWADSLDALKLPQDAEILMIERTPDGGVRSLAAEPGPDGLMLTWTIAGERHPVDDTVRAWAAEMLGRLLRRE